MELPVMGLGGAGSPEAFPYLQRREWQHGKPSPHPQTCFGGTRTLKAFTPQITAICRTTGISGIPCLELWQCLLFSWVSPSTW